MNNPSNHLAIRQRFAWLPACAIWLLFSGWSLIRIPIPGVNEPHYLGKAKHWWNPAWCPGDFFLDSANPHQVFYFTFGWETQFLSLPLSAVVGRLIGLLILACGWQQMIHVITGRKWAALLVTPLFLMLQTLGNFSGEWLVGGIEAKVPAYGFLFWSIGCFLSGRFSLASILAGLSISMHPLVGIWGVVAAVMATIANSYFERRRPRAEPANSQESLKLPDLRTVLLMGLLLVLTSLPGVIPALATVSGTDPAMERTANELQVGDRLSHHLDPMKFPKENFRFWGMMIVIWFLLQAGMKRNAQQQWWRAFVISTFLIAGVGILIGSGPRPINLMPGYEWRLKFLKFYFFRLGDLIAPVAASIAAVRYCLQRRDEAAHPVLANLACGAGVILTALAALLIHFPDENPSRMNPTQLADWKAACVWIEAHSDIADQLAVTDSGWAIKWFTQRPEFVSYKDMPQDSKSIVEWNRRLWVIANWRIASMQDGHVTAAELAELRKSTGIRYMVCRRFGPIMTEPVYANQTFRVYELPD